MQIIENLNTHTFSSYDNTFDFSSNNSIMLQEKTCYEEYNKNKEDIKKEIEQLHDTIIIIDTKIDTITKEYEKIVRSEFQFLSYAPIVYLSALTKKRIHQRKVIYL